MDLINKMDILLERFWEIQGKSKKLLKTDEFEITIIKTIGNPRLYHELGGYPVFSRYIKSLVTKGILQEVKQPVQNGKNPSIHKRYWLIPKYEDHHWKKEDMAKMMSFLDLHFYINHKKHQTDAEFKLVNRIYEFMLHRENRVVINREERSLMIFKNEELPANIEAEKFLSSIEGQRLLNRLRLTEEDLLFKIAREPFTHLINERAPQTHNHEVLIVEGYPTYHTLKTMIERDLPWNFGPVPRFLIWGEGYRIHRTIDFLYELCLDPQELTIRYIGDMDYEGFNIYIELKRKNAQLTINLAHAFYSFLSHYVNEFAANVLTNQRIDDSYLLILKEEVKEYKEVHEVINYLWKHGKRIPQECINLETIFKKGGFY